VAETEVASLAGIKEGCEDDVDFIDVQRSSSVASAGLANGSSASGGALKWVKVPLGSVRASLGHMSTFEDVEAFCQFLEATYVA